MGQSNKQLHLIAITESGRPVTRFPFFVLRNKNDFLLLLERIDISDVGNRYAVDPIYAPLVSFSPGMIVFKKFAIFYSKRGVRFEKFSVE